MKNLAQLIERAKEYAAAYASRYQVTDEATLHAIYISHLTYLLNQ